MTTSSLSTWIEISQSAFLHNIEQLQKRLGKTQLAIVVKSNAYGHGLNLIASLLEGIPSVPWICTASIEQALALRSAGCTKKILAITYHDGLSAEVIHKNIDVMVDTSESLRELNTYASSANKKAHAHLKVDIGLSRRGIMPGEVLEFLKNAHHYKAVEISGIFAHVSDASSGDKALISEQLAIFNNVLAQLSASHITIPCTHALSSGTVTALSTNEHPISSPYTYSIARIGTYAYGLWKSDKQKQQTLAQDHFELHPVMEWKSRIVVIQESSFMPSQRIAYIPITCSDGYPERLLDTACIIIEGHQAPLVKSLSSVMLAADVSTIPTARRGSDVVLMGKPAGVQINELGAAAGTNNNELLTSISPSIRRILVP